MSRRNKILTAVIAIAVMISLILGGCGQKTTTAGTSGDTGKTYTIKLAHESPSNSPKGIWAEDFKKKLEEQTAGRIKVEIYPSGQLYASDEPTVQAAINGLIQMAIPSTGYMSTIVSQFQVVDLPMIFKDQETLYNFEDGDIGKELLSLLESKGLKGLGYISNVPLDLFSKDKIVTPEDFKGKKIRSYNAVLDDDIKALGGNPVTMAASDMYLALQQGTVNGAITTLTYAAPNKYNEITPFVTRARIGAVIYPITMNMKFWQQLPDNLKNDVLDAVKYATEQNRTSLSQTEEKALTTLKSGGVTVIELTPEQHKEWVAKLQTVYDKYKDKVGAQLLQKVQAFSK